MSKLILVTGKYSGNADWNMFKLNGTLCENYLFLPNVEADHWTLYVVDIPKKQLYLIDPKKVEYQMSRRTINQHNNFRRFLRLSSKFSHNNLHEIDWNEVNYLGKKPKQPNGDNWNCGVYVMYYMRQIAQNLAMEITFDPPEFRKTVAETLLEKSDNMSETCIFCFKSSDHTYQYCTECGNPAHLNCIINIQGDITNFVCPRCVL
ncbi:hypothetical protein TKK_0007665 [Trichogramma kaykai]